MYMCNATFIFFLQLQLAVMHILIYNAADP